MTPRTPDDLPPDWLAAYADGELSPPIVLASNAGSPTTQRPRALGKPESFAFGTPSCGTWSATLPVRAQWHETFEQIALKRRHADERGLAGWGRLAYSPRPQLLSSHFGPQHHV